ncbi:hypothetical protein SBV1_2960006 [Verrucomicrobia bacterium]|nr:hypothetical protein SBV1_2960006 [Verrucomicrobiota bacterium]
MSSKLMTSLIFRRVTRGNPSQAARQRRLGVRKDEQPPIHPGRTEHSLPGVGEIVGLGAALQSAPSFGRLLAREMGTGHGSGFRALGSPAPRGNLASWHPRR